jgi:hypothetical protein
MRNDLGVPTSMLLLAEMLVCHFGCFNLHRIVFHFLVFSCIDEVHCIVLAAACNMWSVTTLRRVLPRFPLEKKRSFYCGMTSSLSDSIKFTLGCSPPGGDSKKKVSRPHGDTLYSGHYQPLLLMNCCTRWSLLTSIHCHWQI